MQKEYDYFWYDGKRENKINLKTYEEKIKLYCAHITCIKNQLETNIIIKSNGEIYKVIFMFDAKLKSATATIVNNRGETFAVYTKYNGIAQQPKYELCNVKPNIQPIGHAEPNIILTDSDESDDDFELQCDLPIKPFGLPNIGNTCFMNASLQCILNCDNFMKKLLQYKSANNIVEYLSELACGNRDMLKKIYGEICSSLWGDPKNQCKNKQEDAYESINAIFDKIQDITQTVKKPKSKIFFDVPNETEKKTEMRRLTCDIDFYLNIINIYFGSYVKNKIICDECGNISLNFVPYLDYSLSITNNEPENTLDNLIKKYFTPFKLTGDEQYNCPKCKKKVNADKIESISQYPNTFIFHLKRFVNANKKNNTNVSFEDKISFNGICHKDVLNKPQNSDSLQQKKLSYDLTGIICHHGGTEFGHYFSFIKRNEKWYRCNDNIVTEIEHYSKYGNINSEAYILFYEKI
jgi:ubiquitin C-terminal hydrolase